MAASVTERRRLLELMDEVFDSGDATPRHEVAVYAVAAAALERSRGRFEDAVRELQDVVCETCPHYYTMALWLLDGS
jgi:hypothetical protein